MTTQVSPGGNYDLPIVSRIWLAPALSASPWHTRMYGDSYEPLPKVQR